MTQQSKENAKKTGYTIALLVFAITTIFWVGFTYAELTGIVRWRVDIAQPRLDQIDVLVTKMDIIALDIKKLNEQMEKFNDNIKEFYKGYDVSKIKKGY